MCHLVMTKWPYCKTFLPHDLFDFWLGLGMVEPLREVQLQEGHLAVFFLARKLFSGLNICLFLGLLENFFGVKE